MRNKRIKHVLFDSKQINIRFILTYIQSNQISRRTLPQSWLSTFIYRLSSHRRKSAACPKFEMFWLHTFLANPSGERGVISSFTWFLPALQHEEEGGKGSAPRGGELIYAAWQDCVRSGEFRVCEAISPVPEGKLLLSYIRNVSFTSRRIFYFLFCIVHFPVFIFRCRCSRLTFLYNYFCLFAKPCGFFSCRALRVFFSC